MADQEPSKPCTPQPTGGMSSDYEDHGGRDANPSSQEAQRDAMSPPPSRDEVFEALGADPDDLPPPPPPTVGGDGPVGGGGGIDDRGTHGGGTAGAPSDDEVVEEKDAPPSPS